MEKNRNADFIRAVAIAAVVFTHATDPLQKAVGAVSTGWWLTADIYLSAARPCVPLFFMLSGMLLLGKEEGPVEFYKKRLLRILPPFMAWSAFYFMLRTAVGEKSLTLPAMAGELFTGRAYFHLWFVYVILGLYLVTPVLRSLLASFPKSVPALILASFLYSLLYSHFHRDYSLMPVFPAYLFYYLLGYYLGNLKVKTGLAPAGLFAAFYILGACYTALETFDISFTQGRFVDRYYDYLSPNVALMSIGIFMLLNSVRLERPHIPASGMKAVGLVASSSLGIYMMHPVVLSFLQNNLHGLAGSGMAVNQLIPHPAMSIPVAAALTVVACTAAVYGVKKIPFLRALV